MESVKLYLCRHGEALPGPVDRARELSAEGRGDVERTAAFLGASGVRVVRVGHSGLARARQTAEILAAAVAPGCTPQEMEGLLSEDSTDSIAWQLRDLEMDTLLVSHMPMLGDLVARLVTGKEVADVVRFRAGAVVALERVGSVWVLDWMLTPRLFREH